MARHSIALARRSKSEQPTWCFDPRGRRGWGPDRGGCGAVARPVRSLGREEVALSTLIEGDPRAAAAALIEAHRGHSDWLDEFADAFDRHRAGADLERVLRIWGLSRTEAGKLFGVSRQAVSKWIDHGVPADRAEQLADMARTTDLLVRHLKRDRIPAVVRRQAPALDGRSLVELLEASGPAAVLEATREMFTFGDVHA